MDDYIVFLFILVQYMLKSLSISKYEQSDHSITLITLRKGRSSSS